MKDKYITERFPSWYVFGEYPNGNVDVADPNGDVLTRIPKDTAERIIEARNVFVATVIKEINNLTPEQQRDIFP